MQSLNEELNTINAELTAKVEELDRANSDLRNLFVATRIATVFLDRNLVVRNFTPDASSFFRLRQADIGRPLTDLSSRLDYPSLQQHIEEVFNSGEAFEHQLTRDAEGKHYLLRLIPYRDGGRIEGVVVTFVDVTRLADAEGHQQVLIAELNHRVKNMLTVVISIANQTLKSARSPEQFTAALTGRLHAMSRGYALLAHGDWKEAAVAKLVKAEMETFDEKRFCIHGPDIHLSPQQALSVGLVLHELATNAAKYGALSSPEGTVHITWSAKANRFHLAWVEKNGPAAAVPDRQGFGLALVKGEIEYRLAGQVTTSFDSPGFQLQMSFEIDPKG